MTNTRKWNGTWPTNCQICERSLAEFKSFIDGVTIGGHWALMCPPCHSRNGYGLGVGKGQKYDSQSLEKLNG